MPPLGYIALAGFFYLGGMEMGKVEVRQVDTALPTSLAAVDDPQLTTKSVHRFRAIGSHRVCKRRDLQTTCIT